MKRIISFIIFVFAFALIANADSGKLKFESTVHDFGPVLMSDGPVKCVFKATNVSSQSIVIRSVTSSCNCTVPTWPHEEIAPGQNFKISATYSNDEGPYPFDKTLTVKLVGESTPIILHIRGISQEKQKADKEVYTTVFGASLGMLSDQFKLGNMVQGSSRSDQTTVVNLSSAPIKVSFLNASPSLSVNLSPNPIPAHARATLYYSVESKPGVWGWNTYKTQLCINGTPSGKVVSIRAFTAADFSSLTQEQKSMGSRPVFKESTFSFGHKKKGSVIDATFVCENKGKSKLHIYKVDTDSAAAVPGEFKDIEVGQSGHFNLRLDTKNLPCGEALIIVTLTTNSPLRPVVNLFIAGWID